MSWAAHEFETYVLQKHLGRRVTLLPLLLGAYAPDLFTKWFVYGIDVGGLHLAADDPAQFHRGWPGAGFTHSLLFGVALALVVLFITRNRVWAVSVLIGDWAHALTDTSDSLGTMLFWPLSTEHITIGAWAYGTEGGRYGDAGSYYSSLGLVMDGAWLVIGLLNWRVFTRAYFLSTVAPVDPVWAWLCKYLPETALLALYRGAFFYGATRFAAWMIWAHVTHDYAFDLRWGGPSWVEKVEP